MLRTAASIPTAINMVPGYVAKSRRHMRHVCAVDAAASPMMTSYAYPPFPLDTLDLEFSRPAPHPSATTHAVYPGRPDSSCTVAIVKGDAGLLLSMTQNEHTDMRG
jgi:hypothetical protein